MNRTPKIYDDKEDILRRILAAEQDLHYSSAFDFLFNRLSQQLDNLPKNNSHLFFCCINFLKATSHYLIILRNNSKGPISLQAWCARSLFELALQVRRVSLGEADLERWLAEYYVDVEDQGSTFLKLDKDNVTGEKDVIMVGLERCKEQRGQLSEIEKHQQMIDVAKHVGLSEDYASLAKLFHKVTHPTSFFVNGIVAEDECEDTGFVRTFLSHGLVFASDISGQIDKIVAGASKV